MIVRLEVSSFCQFETITGEFGPGDAPPEALTVEIVKVMRSTQMGSFHKMLQTLPIFYIKKRETIYFT